MRIHQPHPPLPHQHHLWMHRLSEKLPPLDMCNTFFFRLADCHLALLCAFHRLSLPEALFDAFPWNLSLPELISAPLSVFQVSVSHLHQAQLDLSPQPPEAPVYLLCGIRLYCFLAFPTFRNSRWFLFQHSFLFILFYAAVVLFGIQ